MTFVDVDEAKSTARWLAKSTGKVVYLFKYTDYHYEVEVFSWYFDTPFMKFYADGTEEITHLYREGETDENEETEASRRN